MCLYPTLILNRRYTLTKKNGGNIPPITDPRTVWVPIGCQFCLECRKQRARSWQARLLEDIKHHENGKFVTLTFSNEKIAEMINNPKGLKLYEGLKDLKGYDLDAAIARAGVRGFLERWRKHHKKSVRHWLVTELGHRGTENIHLHGIIWTDETFHEIEERWANGFVWTGDYKNGKRVNYVNESTVNYIIKYVTKPDMQHLNFKSEVLASPGIGAKYIATTSAKRNRYNGEQTNEAYRTRTGHKISMPIYWRNKIYSEQDRERLWIMKLDKQERWVCGSKIDITNGLKEYWATVMYHRERTEQIGYPSMKKKWKQQEYEEAMRQLNMAKRLKQTS